MKKQLFTLAIAALAATQLSAQTQKKKTLPAQDLSNKKTVSAPPSNVYSFSTFTAPYLPINGTSLTNGLKWDDPNQAIPLGFNFSLYNTNGSTIYFWGGSSLSFNDFDNDMVLTEAGAIWEDMCDRSYNPSTDNEGDAGGTSTISHTTIGTPGNQICIIQLDNVGFYGENDVNGVSTSFVNLQIWLYESTSDIEFRYGNVSVPNKTECYYNGTSGFLCGLVDSLDYNTSASFQSNFLNGPHGSPTMVAVSGSFSEAVSGDIADGRVYKFSRSVPTGLSKVNGIKGISVYPNPTKEMVRVEGNIPSDATISLYDIAGKLVIEKRNIKSLSVSDLERGIYLLKITSDNSELYSGKLLITE